VIGKAIICIKYFIQINISKYLHKTNPLKVNSNTKNKNIKLKKAFSLILYVLLEEYDPQLYIYCHAERIKRKEVDLQSSQ